jgi:hypothetical protein
MSKMEIHLKPLKICRPLSDVIGMPLTVAAGISPPLILKLGYVDDDYSDNGYYSHDDGVAGTTYPVTVDPSVGFSSASEEKAMKYRYQDRANNHISLLRVVRQFKRLNNISLYFLSLVFTIFLATAAHAACEPGANQAAFFKDANFGNSCVVRDIGDYPNSGAIGLPNDSISSVKLGSNTQVVLCKDNNFQGDCILLKSSQSFVNDNRVGNDQTSSVKVQPLGFASCMPSSTQVSFYVNADFLGTCVVKDVGDYPNSGAIGLPNDSISAIRVGSNVQVVICKDNNFQGDCILLTSSVGFLNNNRVGNDQVSSAKVQTRGFTPCQPGANQAAFFIDADFLGSCVVKNIGNFPPLNRLACPMIQFRRSGSATKRRSRYVPTCSTKATAFW